MIVVINYVNFETRNDDDLYRRGIYLYSFFLDCLQQKRPIITNLFFLHSRNFVDYLVGTRGQFIP